jgi:hypothetical protein
MEALRAIPPSAIHLPDGGVQYETPAEFTRRLVNRAIRHLVDVGLLAVAPDAEKKMEQGIPMQWRP